MNIGIVVTARVKSSRLNEKVLQKIGNQTSFEILLDHLSNDKYPVVVAIPNNKDDNILKEISERKGFEVYRGQDDSPLHRLTECSKFYEFDHVVRITADDILIDLTLLFNQINMHVRGSHDYTFMRRCPDGVAGEVIRVSCLEEVCEDVGNKPIEFTSYYIKNKYESFEYYPPREYQHPFRLTMDYPEDLLLLRLIYASLINPGTLDIINFLKNHPYFTQINRLPAVTLYTCNYNTGKFVYDCIESIYKSELVYNDFEYIIIDDHSEDESLNIISEYYTQLDRDFQSRVKILRNNKNIGLPACCNKVLNYARGKYIMRIDSDDVIIQDILPKMIEKMKIDGSQACFSGYYETKEKLSITSSITENMYHPACSLLSTWSVNELKYQEGLKYEDGKEFMDRFKKKYKISFIDDQLWKYRQHPGQKTAQSDHPKNKVN